MSKLTPHKAEQVINTYLARHEPLKEVGAQVLPGTARHDKWGWSVSIASERAPLTTFTYVDELVTVSEELRRDFKDEFLLAPSGISPSKVK